MTAPLTLPGEIPGLLRYCSPVVFSAGGVCPGVVVNPDITHKGESMAIVWWPSDENGVGKPSMRNSVLLDLRDATGRAHAALWMEAHVEYLRGDLMAAAPAVGIKGWSSCTAWGIVAVTRQEGAMSVLFDADDIDALANLDPDDPRLLPDGSRWVDAEALRLVCLHVAGPNQ